MPQQSKNAKNAMFNAFECFISKKPVSKITVKDITDHCGVNRMTFYYHFKDIYDLVDQSIEEKAKNCGYRTDTDDNWHKKLLRIFKTMRAEKKFFMNVYRSVGREYSEKKLLEYFYDVSVDFIDEEASKLQISTPRKSVLAEYYRYALMGFALYWLNSDMREKPEDMVAHIQLLIQHGIASTITEIGEEKQ